MAGVLEHISFAKEWLYKAERKIKMGEILEGEMLLSLAESETHKAWEESVSRRQKKSEKKFTIKTVIAVVLLIVVAAGSFYYFDDSFLTESTVESREIKLTEGYRKIVEQSQKQVKLINVDLSIDRRE